ncbi:snRNA-activating protein complex subunit 1b isoform X1 [Cyclopterus lumpus]|uniref:snRNA-activating protein complex subunit 1b isoform X1 n=1 Tax=Cyclopterus lumpus TaxID=8103 RepID=UPI001486459F|nr:snRNA-activating protein complex subunit 1b isoform X1 [Cyclopterus lumpus]
MDLCRKQVKSDCAELLSRFQITDSVRFETFSKIWREMQFSQIFYGTVNHQERRAFSRLVLDTAYGFFMPPYSFQIKVGGLYLLYSLYQCQIASPPEQIRLALKDWENVKKLEKDAVNAQHHDVVYILRKLASDKAFSFAAMPTTLAFKKKRKVERPEVHEEFMERPSRPQELINVELLEELSNIDELYRKLKASVSSEVQQADSSIDLVRKDLVPQLRSTVMDFYDWQQRRDADGVEEAGEGTSSQQERAALLTEQLFCVLSAPTEPSASPSSSQRPTERQRRPPSPGVIVRWRWTSRATWPDPPTRQVTPGHVSCHSKPEPTRTYASQTTCGKKPRRRLTSNVSPSWTSVQKKTRNR